MNQCPSCGAERDEALNVCQECGHVFDEPKRTIMGFPGLKAALDAEPDEPIDANKQTLFGFPAQKFGQSAEPADTTQPDSEDFEDDETNIMADPRGTIAGFNVQDHAFPRQTDSEGLDEESDDDGPTMVGSPLIGSEVKTIEEEREDEESSNRGFGTVMGVSVADIMSGEHDDVPSPVTPAASNPKSTQFAMPAFSPDDEEDSNETEPVIPGLNVGNPKTTQFAMPAFSDDDEESESEVEEEEAHTVTWNPDMIPSSPDDSDQKKELLAKLRKNKPQVSRETDAKGLPSLKGSKPLPKPGALGSKLGLSVPKPKPLIGKREEIKTPLEFPEDETEMDTVGKNVADTATTGVLKRAGESRRQVNPSNGGSPIAGAYVVSKDELTADEFGDDDEAPTEMIQAPSFLDNPSHSLPIQDTEAEDDEDLAYAETGIVPGNIADRVLADVRSEAESPSLDPWAAAETDLSVQDQVAQTQERNTPEPQSYSTDPNVPVQTPQTPHQTTQPVSTPPIQPYSPPQPAMPQQAPNQPLAQQQPNRPVLATQHANVASDDEKLVGYIQTGFGLLGAFVTFIVVASTIFGPSIPLPGWLPVAVSMLMAVILGAGSLFPLKSKTKTIIFAVTAFIIFAMGLIGFVAGVTFWFGWLFAAAFALCGAVFPVIAKKIL